MTLNQSPVHRCLFFDAHLNGFASMRSLLITPTTPALISRITHPTVYRLDPLRTHLLLLDLILAPSDEHGRKRRNGLGPT